MKKFIVIGNSVALDVSPGSPYEGKRAPDNGFIVDAPDHVFEGWGYAVGKDGREIFLRPAPPDGWSYDEATGTFYREGTA